MRISSCLLFQIHLDGAILDPSSHTCALNPALILSPTYCLLDGRTGKDARAFDRLLMDLRKQNRCFVSDKHQHNRLRGTPFGQPVQTPRGPCYYPFTQRRPELGPESERVRGRTGVEAIHPYPTGSRTRPVRCRFGSGPRAPCGTCRVRSPSSSEGPF